MDHSMELSGNVVLDVDQDGQGHGQYGTSA